MLSTATKALSTMKTLHIHYAAEYPSNIILFYQTRMEKAMARLKVLQDGGLDVATCMNDAKARMSGQCDDDTDSFDSGHQIMTKDSSVSLGDRTSDHFEDSGSVKVSDFKESLSYIFMN